MWTALLCVAVVGGFLYAIWAMYFQGHTRVEPAGRERLVVRDIFGSMAVKGPGDHFLPFWQVEFVRVSVNREPIKVSGEEVKSSNGVVLLLDYRYDIIAGRPFDTNHGQLLVPPSDVDNHASVKDDLIKQAVTRIDWPKRHEQVSQLVSAVIEDVFAAWTDEELMLPGDKQPRIPNEAKEEAWIFQVQRVQEKGEVGPSRPYFQTPVTEVTSAAELYNRLSTLIELKVNHDKLITFGVNVIAFQVTNLRYKEPEMQTSVEMKARMRNLRKAMERPGEPSDLSDAEILAATKPGELGQAVLGKGIAEAGKSLGEGLKKKNNEGEKK